MSDHACHEASLIEDACRSAHVVAVWGRLGAEVYGDTQKCSSFAITDLVRLSRSVSNATFTDRQESQSDGVQQTAAMRDGLNTDQCLHVACLASSLVGKLTLVEVLKKVSQTSKRLCVFDVLKQGLPGAHHSSPSLQQHQHHPAHAVSYPDAAAASCCGSP